MHNCCSPVSTRPTMSLSFSRSGISLCSEAGSLLSPSSSRFPTVAVGQNSFGFENTTLQWKGSAVNFSPKNGCSFPFSSMPSHRALAPRATSGTAQESKTAGKSIYEENAKVVQVHTVQQFDDALAAAKSKLVVVEYAASHSANSRRIYPSMVELSRTCHDAVFILVMGDESDETKELCKRVGIEKVPHFIFYKNQEIIHEEEGIGPDELLGDVLYYGDPDAPILQLHNREDVDALLAKHAADDKLVVLDVGLKHCGPCVKVYPTFVKLAKKMKETAVFARMNGDENQECMELLKEMDVVEVPTFLFIRDGKLCGRYVGSGKGELIGEILRYQGVRVTY